jgi:hypothetical protein
METGGLLMQLFLKRKWFSPESSIGELSIEGLAFKCFTLEDPVRDGLKIYGRTAIPDGTYGVDITMSARFKRFMPILRNVPGFEGIRIHTGNTARNTEGCILVGRTRGLDWIGHSRDAYDELYGILDCALDSGERVFITITNEIMEVAA